MDSSQIVINGKSNVVDFSFHQNAGNFIKETMAFTANQVEDKIYLSENTLSLEVKKFESNNKMALRDFFKLVKADKNPNILIKLDYIELAKDNLSKQPADEIHSNAHVKFTIVGVENEYIIPVKAMNKDGKLRLTGSKKINIKDFGLTPADEFFGLIKISNWIEIAFQINVSVKIEK
jgi:general stress protein 26